MLVKLFEPIVATPEVCKHFSPFLHILEHDSGECLLRPVLHMYGAHLLGPPFVKAEDPDFLAVGPSHGGKDGLIYLNYLATQAQLLPPVLILGVNVNLLARRLVQDGDIAVGHDASDLFQLNRCLQSIVVLHEVVQHYSQLLHNRHS